MARAPLASRVEPSVTLHRFKNFRHDASLQGGTCAPKLRSATMSNTSQTIAPELRELLDMEVADIIATANEQGFSTRDVLFGLAAAIVASQAALGEDPDPADDPFDLPVGPLSEPDFIDPSKTPGTAELSGTARGDVDPGSTSTIS